MNHLKLFEEFSPLKNKTLIVVDIQPAYQKGFNFKMRDFINFINKNINRFDSVIFLYNGSDLGFPDESEYKLWLYDYGLEEEYLDYIKFFEKGYAFIRNPIDYGIEDDLIILVLKYMWKNGITDSRDLTTENWDDIENIYGGEIDISEIREYLEENEDNIYITDLMEYLDKIHGDILLTGGGRDECLKEVELVLDALGKKYKLYEKFVY